MNQRKNYFFSRRITSVPHWVQFSLLLLIVAISYSNSLYSPFVLDDFHSFIEDPKVFVSDFSFKSLEQLSATKFGTARLLPIISFAIDHHLSNGQSMAQYHITNILIHLLSTTALFFFLNGLLQTCVGKRTLTFIRPELFVLFVCGLWALSPVQTNAVTYIVQRMTSMAAFFYLTSLACYIHGRQAEGGWAKFFFFLGTALAAICAFLSKQNSATLPIALVLVECMFISPGLVGKIIKSMKWYHWLGIALLIAILLPLGEHFWISNVNSFANRRFTMWERLLTESRVLVFYISLLALPLPARMNLEHDFPLSHSLVDPLTTAGAVVLLFVFVGIAFVYRKRFPLISFGIFWFFLNLVIESTFLNLELVFEHRLYLPSVGFFVVIMAAIDHLAGRKAQPGRSNEELRKIFSLAGIIFVSLSSVLTTLRNYDWLDGITIYEDCVKKSPQKSRAYCNLGVALGREGRYDEALQIFYKAIAVGKPQYEDYLNAANNILVTLIEQGYPEEAIKQGEKFLEEAPENLDTSCYIKYMYNLGAAYYQTGRYQEALRKYAGGFVLADPAEKKRFIDRMLQVLMDGYDDPGMRKALKLSEGGCSKEQAVVQRMSELLLEFKAYNQASEFIQKMLIARPDDEKGLLIKKRYEEETEKNRKQLESGLLSSQNIYKINYTYRYSLIAANFILKYYWPLHITVGWLLDKAQSQVPVVDPFVTLYRIKWYFEDGQTEKAIEKLGSALENHQDFIPILEMAVNYHNKIGNQRIAARICEHILELYPGNPNWYPYTKIISQSEENYEYGKRPALTDDISRRSTNNSYSF